MRCSLYPYKRKDVASIQEARQRLGWQVTAFDIPAAWRYSRGGGVTVAVIDTGCCRDHPDLVDNVLDGFNVLKPGRPPDDDNDHGTFVAGCICAADNDIGMVGVAPQAKVVPVKVLDADGSGDMSDVAKGVRYATERGVDMMCLSLGSGRPLASLRRAIQAAAKRGIPVFCAGGNVSRAMDAMYPARYPETIAIAALDKEYERADFSNTAKGNLDFLAPGVDILSTVRGGWYAVLSGSSMAVPFAVGMAALALAAPGGRQSLTTVDSYRQAFRDHGVDQARYRGDRVFAGQGIIDPLRLLGWLAGATP